VKPRWARLEGFSLHANVAVSAYARARLEHLCRDLLRPPPALERRSESSHGQRLSELAHPRTDGSTHVLLDPLELIEQLCVLVPAPRTHVLRDHGVLAPPAPRRSLIVPRAPEDAVHEARALAAREPARPLVAVHTRPETLRPLLARRGLDVPPAAPRASRAPPTPAA
jgi:hypothetical protein